MKNISRGSGFLALLLVLSVTALAQKPLAYEGAFQSGYRDTKITFVLSPDGKQLTELGFVGNIKC
jgi:hypothetical protein